MFRRLHKNLLIDRSRNIRIDANSPSLKQPLRYVASIPIQHTPISQFLRSDTGFSGQSQSEHPRFKLRAQDRRNGREPTRTPTRIRPFGVQVSIPVGSDLSLNDGSLAALAKPAQHIHDQND